MAKNMATPSRVDARGRRNSKVIWAALAVVSIVWWMSNNPLLADVIYRRGLAKPLVGQVVEENDAELVLRFETPQQGIPQITIPRDDLVERIQTISATRLDELVDGTWEPYRNYAEELAAFRIDPAAQRLAIRLYLIVAFRADGELRRGALRALIELARTPEEEKRFRTLAYQVDSIQDPSILKPPQQVAPVQLFDQDIQIQLLQCLRLARQGSSEQAIALAREPEVRAGFEAISHLMSLREFEATAYDTPVKGERLRRLLQVELALMGAGARQESDSDSHLLAPGWSQLIANGQTQPFEPVTWQNVTEFDPQKSRYHNGSWELP